MSRTIFCRHKKTQHLAGFKKWVFPTLFDKVGVGCYPPCSFHDHKTALYSPLAKEGHTMQGVIFICILIPFLLRLQSEGKRNELPLCE